MPRPPKRNQLIETALRLFSQYGFHAVGIDRVVEEAGITKKTLYNHFRSKNELILAALRRNDAEFRNNFVRSVESKGKTSRERLLAIFDVAEEWFLSNTFYGCTFINAIAEFSDRWKPIQHICKEYKQLVTDYIANLARDANAENPEELAERLSLLLEGAIVTAQVSEKTNSAKRAKEIAILLIDRECNFQ